VPVDPDRLNAVGDLVLTEADELRTLADPLRLTLFDLVRRDGPLTTGELEARVDEEPTALDTNLRALASIGLLEEDGEGRWTAAARGIFFEIPEEPEAQRAARDLSNVMLAKYASIPVAWVADEEPKLDLEWARAAGLFNVRLDVTADELRGLQEDLERLLEPFTNRPESERPAEAAKVRIMAYFMPEPAPGDYPRAE
jgi:DNA-binding transcriptional ArsR family regulator